MGEEMKEKKRKDRPEIQLRSISHLGDLTPEIIHKLNMPLASVIGYAELLLPRMTDPEEKKTLEKIREEAKRASEIIKAFVDFIRKENPKKEVVNLNELIEEVSRAKTHALNLRNISLVKELSPSIPLTLLDSEQIQKALLNLINNAEEAISEFHGFGEIRVKTSVMDGQIEVTVSDDGPGIPKENISKIFDPLFTTKGKGIGLGLAISNDILIRHGGTIKVKSELGKGATFIFHLPLLEIKGDRIKEEGAMVEAELKGKKGLVVDDDLNFLNLVYKYLGLQGCEIITASDVETALVTIEQRDFDFVICDMKMPGMSGAHFYHFVKEKKPSLKDRTIFITGDVMGERTKTFMETIANPHIEKPFDLNELKKVIIKMISEH